MKPKVSWKSIVLKHYSKQNKHKFYIQNKINELKSIENPTKENYQSISIYRNFLRIIEEPSSTKKD